MVARGLNKVMLIGNLGRDPETRYTQAGSAVARFSIATSDSWRDRNTQEMQERTEWHNVVCFGRLAEIAGEYLRKGSKVYIEGALRTSSWEQDGATRYRTEVIAREMQMLDSRGGGASDTYGNPPPHGAGGQIDGQAEDPQKNSGSVAADQDDFDDDIPF